MSDNNESKPASALGHDAMKAIGGELRRVYAEIVAEGVREHFAAIVRKLDEASNKGGEPMTLVLRKQSAEDRIEGRDPPPDWSDDDYAVVDEKLVGRNLQAAGAGRYQVAVVPADGAGPLLSLRAGAVGECSP